jgi:hypothetical protein
MGIVVGRGNPGGEWIEKRELGRWAAGWGGGRLMILTMTILSRGD